MVGSLNIIISDATSERMFHFHCKYQFIFSTSFGVENHLGLGRKVNSINIVVFLFFTNFLSQF